MKAISLWQPWASLIADGRKPYETRHWAPPAALIGQRIAIHAAKKWNSELGMQALGFGYLNRPPLGAVVATARLAAAHQLAEPFGEWNGNWYVRIARTIGTDDSVRTVNWQRLLREDRYGDYSPGRWAWRLSAVERFDVPIPARGKQGFWTWKR